MKFYPIQNLGIKTLSLQGEAISRKKNPLHEPIVQKEHAFWCDIKKCSCKMMNPSKPALILVQKENCQYIKSNPTSKKVGIQANKTEFHIITIECPNPIKVY